MEREKSNAVIFNLLGLINILISDVGFWMQCRIINDYSNEPTLFEIKEAEEFIHGIFSHKDENEFKICFWEDFTAGNW